MRPKRKQIKEGLERLELWIDRESLLLVQMRMTFPGGDRKTIRLDDVDRERAGHRRDVSDPTLVGQRFASGRASGIAVLSSARPARARGGSLRGASSAES